MLIVDWSRCESANAIVKALRAGEGAFVSGLYGSSRPFFVSSIANRWRGPVLVVTSGAKEERDFCDDLRTFSSRPVYLFPARETMPDEGREHPDIMEDRFRVLDMLLTGKLDGVLVTSIKAILEKLPSKSSLSSSIMEIEEGKKLNLRTAVSRLGKLGYEREVMVMERGQYSVRGGILDIFPSNAEAPLRVELDGDAVASVRTFDTANQRSKSRKKGFSVMVYDEFIHGKRVASILDYLPESSLICFDEPAGVKEAAVRLASSGMPLLTFSDVIGKSRSFSLAYLSDIGGEIEEIGQMRKVVVDTRSAALFSRGEAFPEVKAEYWHGAFDRIAGWVEEGYKIFVYCNNEGERARLLELIGDKAKLIDSLSIGSASSPFLLPELKLAFITDSEIFGRYKIRKPRRRVSKMPFKAVPSEIEAGDYVVHVDQGVGRYIGLRKLKRKGEEREFMAIEYSGGAKLYVPLEQAHLVQRYIGPGRRRPALDVLGSMKWTHRKARVERAIIDFASELLELQAIRSTLRGISFSADTPWQREFEISFIYEETPDQERSIAEVKADMERARPMDRLICGDVGYGKTEVAIRAAFKAVMDGKQVAVLVPTTVLAQQHFNTFRDRLADYPLELRVLSRFQSPGEQRETLEGLISGRVDIVIGTHRLLQGDVLFNDLGLIVIDEEQRFGVAHKERLKQLRKLVDVLTMTATPIPRTLYMSITGLRDMSVIDTPPQDRLAVHTEIIHYEEGVVREVILRELAREGQMYYVHNRVATIQGVAEKIGRLVPEASVAVAHGQMDDELLAGTMERFFAGDMDILVCTTIIESGLDIPNVNTIFIDDAHRFGLADLYQLRGRVGRYKHRAFAYLIIPRGPIGDEGRRRLRAIAEHSELGAGFSIAMRDLEIRGTGNILGREQHGHIVAIGFDLYCGLLKTTIERLKGREVRPRYEVSINIGFYPYVPPEYVPTGRLRVDLYRRLAVAESIEEIDAIGREMRDRFGPLTDQVKDYLDLAKIKLRAWLAGVRSIELVGNRLFFDTLRGRIIEKVRPKSFQEIVRAARKVLSGRE